VTRLPRPDIMIVIHSIFRPVGYMPSFIRKESGKETDTESFSDLS